MATIIEKTIGTGGDYPDLPTWLSTFVPASLVAADELHRALMLNQEHSSGSTITIGGKTTDATRYIEITAAPSASFRDHTSKATNALRYNPANGAAIKCTGTAAVITVNQQYTRINNLQILQADTTSSAQGTIATSANGTYLTLKNMILESSGVNSAAPGALRITVMNCVMHRVLVVQRKNSATAITAVLHNGVIAHNCAFVNVGGTPANYGIQTQYIANQFVNCYIGGVVAPEDGTIAATKTNSYCNATATGYSVAAFDTTNFMNVTNGTLDMRLSATSALLEVGSSASTYGSQDILGTSCPQGGAYDVGVFEYPGVGDTTAPTLTTPTGTSTGTTTSSGSVSTNEANGTLYWLTNTSSSATAVAVKAGSSQSVNAAGTQNTTSSGLTASTGYYTHYLHQDNAGNDSTVASSAMFTTSAAGDVTAPVLSSPTATATGNTTASGTVTTNEANGTLYRYVSANATETAATIKSLGQTSAVTATGVQNVTFTGLPAGTLQYAHYVHRDAAGNDSTVANSASFTTTSSSGSYLSSKLGNNTSFGHASGTAVYWQWHQGGRIGAAATSITYGNGTLNVDGKLALSGLPLGAGFLLGSVRGATAAQDSPFYEYGTVT